MFAVLVCIYINNNKSLAVEKVTREIEENENIIDMVNFASLILDIVSRVTLDAIRKLSRSSDGVKQMVNMVTFALSRKRV